MKPDLLVIRLKDEDSVPGVYFKGIEITNKINVSFDWDTEDMVSMGGLSYRVEHLEEDGTANLLERRTKGHV